MVQRRAWPGSSNRKGSRRSFLSSTSPIGRTVRCPAPTSPSIAERGRYMCPAGKELVQFRRTYATPRKRRHGRGDKALSRQQIGLRSLRTQSAMLPERGRPQDPAGSARRRSRRRSGSRLDARIRGRLSASKENRDAVRPSQANSSPRALAPKGSERGKRRVPPRRNRPKPEAPRPLETDQKRSGNAGRITPRLRPQKPPSKAQTAPPAKRPKTDPLFQRYMREADH